MENAYWGRNFKHTKALIVVQQYFEHRMFKMPRDKRKNELEGKTEKQVKAIVRKELMAGGFLNVRRSGPFVMLEIYKWALSPSSEIKTSHKTS